MLRIPVGPSNLERDQRPPHDRTTVGSPARPWRLGRSTCIGFGRLSHMQLMLNALQARAGELPRLSRLSYAQAEWWRLCKKTTLRSCHTREVCSWSKANCSSCNRKPGSAGGAMGASCESGELCRPRLCSGLLTFSDMVDHSLKSCGQACACLKHAWP